MGRQGRPLFRDRRTAIALGVGLLIGAYVCLYDAYDRRGHTKPLLMRPAVPF